MDTALFPSIGFTICGLIFLTLIMVMYIFKKKFNNLENKIYRIMMFIVFFLLILEIVCVYTMSIRSKIPILNEVLCRIYIFGSIVFVSFFILYMLSLGIINNEKRRLKFKVPTISILVIIDVILFIFSCFMPISYTSGANNELFVIGGSAVYALYGISFLLIAILLFSILKNGGKLPISQRIPLYFVFILFIVITAIQQFWVDFNDLTFIFSFAVIAMYFTIESQDNKLLIELEKSKEKAELADKSKTEFLSNMSHEIRTPLNTILGFSRSLLREKKLTKEMVNKDVTSIYAASISLLDLINNILDISKIESGKLELVEKEYDLDSLVFEISSTVSSKINKDILNFNIKVDENIPSKYYGDNSKIYKILVCVLANAIKYTNCGSVELNIGAQKIDDDNYLLNFLIINTGHAMKEEDFLKSFDDFIKLGDDTQNNIDSVTLGLIIAKRLIMMLGGNIEFKNEEGKGTRYYINIKQKVIDKTKIGKVFDYDKNNSKEEIILDLTGKKALIVDDNSVNIKLASRFLKQYNFDISSASSGNECINLVKNNKYDIIFLDHMMPDLDGVATMKILKDSGYVIPPVIALTANSYSGLKDIYINAGFSDYLSKPINFKELNKLINNFFGNKK